jgi:hypothetical protein
MVSMNEMVTGDVDEPPWFGAVEGVEVRKQFDLLTPGLPLPALVEPAQPATASSTASTPAPRAIGLAVRIMRVPPSTRAGSPVSDSARGFRRGTSTA